MVAAVSAGAGESRYCIHYTSRATTRRALGDVDLIGIAPLMTSNPFVRTATFPFEIRLIGLGYLLRHTIAVGAVF